MVSPTQRALQFCRDHGLTAQVVERWNPHAKVRQDLFGIIDLVVLVGSSILGVQVTSGSNHASRETKAEQEPRLREWLRCGGAFEVWSFSKRGERGKRKLWTRRVTAAACVDGSILWCPVDSIDLSFVSVDEQQSIG